jgi:hypothetical protein
MAVVESEKGKAWRWGHVVFPGFLAAVVIGTFGTSGSLRDDLLTLSICLPVAIGLAYGPCIYWIAVTATRRYELDETSLRVWSRGRIVKVIPTADITGFSIRNYTSTGRVLVRPASWLTWPSGVVSVKSAGGRSRTVYLPEIILWGSEAVRTAQRSFRETLNGYGG